MNNNTFTIGIISLGCAKNRIDSEVILAQFEDIGGIIVSDAATAQVLVVNTCGFVESAKEESINAILEMAEFKKTGICHTLVVTGCLAERYNKELLDEIPEIDILLGTSNYSKIAEAIEAYNRTKKQVSFYGNIDAPLPELPKRTLSTTSNTAYVKISDGCDNHCTYCIIPKLRGKLRCRPAKSILSEVLQLVANGVREVILVAQDVMKYQDSDNSTYIIDNLIKDLSAIKDLKWIRLLYCYPDGITDDFLKTVAKNDKVCKYFDIPIQHVNREILKKMNRPYTKEELQLLHNKIKKLMPDAVLRTSIIVGFPGETDDQLDELNNFIADYPFDLLGVFPYSQEEDTAAALLPDQIAQDVKEERRDLIMSTQKKIVNQKLNKRLNTVIDVMVEDFDETSQLYYGRSYAEAPNIDGCICFSSKEKLCEGDFCLVRITNKFDYDLIGECVNGTSK